MLGFIQSATSENSQNEEYDEVLQLNLNHKKANTRTHRANKRRRIQRNQQSLNDFLKQGSKKRNFDQISNEILQYEISANSDEEYKQVQSQKDKVQKCPSQPLSIQKSGKTTILSQNQIENDHNLSSISESSQEFQKLVFKKQTEKEEPQLEKVVPKKHIPTLLERIQNETKDKQNKRRKVEAKSKPIQKLIKSGCQRRLAFGNNQITENNLAVKPDKQIKLIKGSYVKTEQYQPKDLKEHFDPDFQIKQQKSEELAQIQELQRFERIKKCREAEEIRQNELKIQAEEAAKAKIEVNANCQRYSDFFKISNPNYRILSDKLKNELQSKFGESVLETINRVESIFLNQIQIQNSYIAQQNIEFAQYTVYSKIYSNIMHDQDMSKIQIIKSFINAFNPSSQKPQNSKKKSSQKKMRNCKIMILVGDSDNDTQNIRQYLMEDLKAEMNLDITKISGHTKRTAAAFRGVFTSSQQTSVEKNFKSIFKQEESEKQLNQENYVQKVIFFEDIDVIFEDEKEIFYLQMAKLVQQSKVPIVVSVSKQQAITDDLINPYFWRSIGGDDPEDTIYEKVVEYELLEFQPKPISDIEQVQSSHVISSFDRAFQKQYLESDGKMDQAKFMQRLQDYPEIRLQGSILKSLNSLQILGNQPEMEKNEKDLQQKYTNLPFEDEIENELETYAKQLDHISGATRILDEIEKYKDVCNFEVQNNQKKDIIVEESDDYQDDYQTMFPLVNTNLEVQLNKEKRLGKDQFENEFGAPAISRDHLLKLLSGRSRRINSYFCSTSTQRKPKQEAKETNFTFDPTPDINKTSLQLLLDNKPQSITSNAKNMVNVFDGHVKDLHSFYYDAIDKI